LIPSLRSYVIRRTSCPLYVIQITSCPFKKWSIEDDFTEPGLDIYNIFIIATILISPVKNSSNDLSVTMTVF